MRSALEFETTAQPASAKAGSISAAMESSAAKIILGVPLVGEAEFTVVQQPAPAAALPNARSWRPRISFPQNGLKLKANPLQTTDGFPVSV